MLVLGARGATGYVLGRGAGSAANWWMAAGVTPVAAYAPKGAASLALSYKNLANPGTYDAAPGVAPTFDTLTGWTFNGTQWLTTGVLMSSPRTLIVKFSAISGLYVAGATAAAFFTVYRTSTIVGVELANLYQEAAATGTIVVANAHGQLYVNGTASGTQMSGAYPDRNLYLGARNANGTALNFFAGIISSAWIANTACNAAQVAAQSAAMP